MAPPPLQPPTSLNPLAPPPARIEDQRQDRGSARSSAVLRAVSVMPDAPAPRLRGFGAYCSMVLSMASRITAAISAPLGRDPPETATGLRSSVIVVRSMTECYHRDVALEPAYSTVKLVRIPWV